MSLSKGPALHSSVYLSILLTLQLPLLCPYCQNSVSSSIWPCVFESPFLTILRWFLAAHHLPEPWLREASRGIVVFKAFCSHQIFSSQIFSGSTRVLLRGQICLAIICLFKVYPIFIGSFAQHLLIMVVFLMSMTHFFTRTFYFQMFSNNIERYLWPCLSSLDSQLFESFSLTSLCPGHD